MADTTQGGRVTEKRTYRAQTQKRYYKLHSNKRSDIARLMAKWGVIGDAQERFLQPDPDHVAA